MNNDLDEAQLAWANGEDKKLYYEIAALIVGFLSAWMSPFGDMLTKASEDSAWAAFIPGELMVAVCIFSGVAVAFLLIYLTVIVFAMPRWCEDESLRYKAAYTAKMLILPKSSREGFLCLLDEGLGWAERDKTAGKLKIIDKWDLSEIKHAKIVKCGLLLNTVKIDFADNSTKVFRVINGKNIRSAIDSLNS